VAGSAPVAVDATCCRVMRIDPMQIGYLRLAARAESHLAEARIQQIGEAITDVSTPFELIPEFRKLRLENA
jgi:hypothetical protein